ncbi:MAG TPA: hypothetical protein VHO69_09780 [Phototrophicaceae bacterium]|nr:hypothetical protein [Phototrophicaceae bacterium]
MWQLRADTGERLGAPIPVGSGPRDPVYDGQRFVWISNTDSGTVQRIDLDTIRTGP